MIKEVIKIFVLLLFSLMLMPLPGISSSEPASEIMLIRVDGVINPARAEFIVKAIKKANERKYNAVIMELDTPGGLDTSMRTIIKEMVGSAVPVVVYVSPSGARAASAGAFITIASHIAAMAPGTNIGAAHPVAMGEKMDKEMAKKVTNDAAAYIRSLAESRGRNPKWAEDAVRKSVSVTEKEALELKVIDLIAKDRDELFKKINGRRVKTVFGDTIINTTEAKIVHEEMGFRQRVLDLISDPNIAYILMLLGIYGLFFELTNPGAIFPGVLGGICLILAFYAFQTLPVNYAGILLIILAIILFILEVKIISHGILTIGGIISMIIGSIMLFESPAPFFKLSLYVILPAVIITALFFVITFGLAFKAWKRKPVTGAEGIVGLEGIARTDIRDDGMVYVRGEIWSAMSDEPIKQGERVRVEAVSGLKLKVKKIEQ
ncbi:MAG: NfeD family protein [Thermodesulfovibrionales bacterium]